MNNIQGQPEGGPCMVRPTPRQPPSTSHCVTSPVRRVYEAVTFGHPWHARLRSRFRCINYIRMLR